MNDHYQNPELWISELTAAGWKKINDTMWQSPGGDTYRGPHFAWKMMREYTGKPVAGGAHPGTNTT